MGEKKYCNACDVKRDQWKTVLCFYKDKGTFFRLNKSTPLCYVPLLLSSK